MMLADIAVVGTLSIVLVCSIRPDQSNAIFQLLAIILEYTVSMIELLPKSRNTLYSACLSLHYLISKSE